MHKRSPFGFERGAFGVFIQPTVQLFAQSPRDPTSVLSPNTAPVNAAMKTVDKTRSPVAANPPDVIINREDGTGRARQLKNVTQNTIATP